MSYVRTESRRFNAVGRCIYCKSEGGLTDEHTIASGFNGNNVLPKASCEKCRVMTQQFEQIVMRKMMWPMRHAHQMYSKKRGRPALVDALISNGDDGHRVVKMAPEDIAIKAVLPLFPHMPGVLAGRARDASPETEFVGFMDASAAERSEARGEDRAVMYANEDAFVRMLAKTAHAQAVGLFGIDGFDAALPDVIRGLDPHWGYLIGRAIGGGEESYANKDVWLEIGERVHDGLLVARMKLFARLDSPVYMIVIGRRRPPRFGNGMRAQRRLLSGSNALVPTRLIDAIRHHLALGQDGPIPHRVVVRAEAA